VAKVFRSSLARPVIPRAVPVECGPRSSRAHAAAAPKQRSAGGKQPDRRQLRRLLRARRQRPPGYGAAKQRDELTTPHSKTSSVRSVCRQRTSAASSGDDPRLYPYRVLWCVEPPHCASMVYSFSREYCFNDFRSPFVHSFDSRPIVAPDIRSSFDDLIRAGRNGRRHLDANRLRGTQIDHELEPGRLHCREVGGLGAL